MYVFIDESGQFNKSGSDRYFVAGAFTVGDIKKTSKQFRLWHRSRFPLKLRYKSEIKFSNTITDDLKLRTLRFISNLDIRIHFAYLKKSNIPENYGLDGNLKSGHLYTYVVGEVLECFLSPKEHELRVFCDKRHLKGIKQTEFKKILTVRTLPLLPKNSIIQIEMIDSAHDANIQIADWISGALACYLEKKEFGEEYYAILENNLLGEGKELFRDHWKTYNKKSAE